MNPYREKEALLAALNTMADEKYRAFHASLVPGLQDFLGVRMPNLKKLAKTVAKADAEDFLENYPLTPDSLYEEKMVWGLVCATAKLETQARQKYMRRFLPLVDNWAVCDTVTSSMKFLKKEAAAWKDFVFAAAGGSEFDKRFFAVCTMLYFGGEEYIDEVLETYKHLHGGYYVDMGVAWALATLYLKWKDKILPMLQDGSFADDVVYKTIGKLCDSYRVSDADKAAVRKLRAQMRQKDKARKETAT